MILFLSPSTRQKIYSDRKKSREKPRAFLFFAPRPFRRTRPGRKWDAAVFLPARTHANRNGTDGRKAEAREGSSCKSCFLFLCVPFSLRVVPFWRRSPFRGRLSLRIASEATQRLFCASLVFARPSNGGDLVPFSHRKMTPLKPFVFLFFVLFYRICRIITLVSCAGIPSV